MIDYEKLKTLYDLAEKYSLQKSELGELRILINHLGEYSNRFFFNGIGFATIEALISKLTELTQPEPKYKVGDEAWLNDNDSPGCIFISDITFENHYYEYNGLYYEDRLHPNKQALIEAQFQYWLSLKIEEDAKELGMTRINNPIPKDECQRESDGFSYQRYDGGTIAQNKSSASYQIDKSIPIFDKCKKCGEFYR